MVSCKDNTIYPQGNIIFYSSDQSKSYSISINSEAIKDVKYKANRPLCGDKGFFIIQGEINKDIILNIYSNASFLKTDTIRYKEGECLGYDVSTFILAL